MQVECGSVEEFLECLGAEQYLFQNTVRISIDKIGLGTGPPYASYQVSLYASAVVFVETVESQFLLTAAIDCGKDYLDGEAAKDGTRTAKLLKDKIQQYVKSRNWFVLPGRIST